MSGIIKHLANAVSWKAVCVEPDLCRVGKDVVAFNSHATLNTPVLASPDVKAQGAVVYRQGDILKKVQGDAGAHLVSGTSLGSGHVKILEGQANVKVNGKPVARHNSRCQINCDAAGVGGAKGKLITEEKKGKNKGSTATNPEAPAGERTSKLLEELMAARDKLKADQLDLNALDEYVDFDAANATLDGAIGQIKGTPGTKGDYLAQSARGVLGFGKDLVTGVGELAYEAVKGVPKLARRAYTSSGRAIGQLDSAILTENIRLGNITPGAIGQGASSIAQAVAKPVTEPWSKGQHVEAVVRGVAEVATLPAGWTKGGRAAKAAEAVKMAEAAKAAEALRVAEAVKMAEAAKAVAATRTAEFEKAAEGATASNATAVGKEMVSTTAHKGNDGVNVKHRAEKKPEEKEVKANSTAAGTPSIGRTLGQYSAVDPGPLADNMAATFTGGKYQVVELYQDTTLYRAGTVGQPLGQYFSAEPPTSVLQARMDKAVLPVWPGGATSPLDSVFEVKIPAGTHVYVGEVGAQSGFYVGGTQQIVVVQPWAIPGVKVINSSPLR